VGAGYVAATGVGCAPDSDGAHFFHQRFLMGNHTAAHPVKSTSFFDKRF
jgi:hypothetical protein